MKFRFSLFQEFCHWVLVFGWFLHAYSYLYANSDKNMHAKIRRRRRYLSIPLRFGASRIFSSSQYPSSALPYPAICFVAVGTSIYRYVWFVLYKMFFLMRFNSFLLCTMHISTSSLVILSVHGIFKMHL